MSTQPATANEIDLALIGQLVERCSNDPEAAQTSWTARTQWTGGFRSASYVREHAPIVTDEPKGLAGSDTAPNPVEYVLAALGSCLTVGYTAAAATQGIELRSLEIEVKGDLDLRVFLGLDKGHAGYSRIEVTAHVDSDADEDQLQRLHESVIATSPVGHTLENPIALRARLVKA
ncbi:MAG: OsmC family protein [Solirubrobacteraceae bacterium]|nr:OsmC family protein [Solirubrobacteraceae bacterium]